MDQFFFCENCREQCREAGELHFVEENSDRGFCSEKCILEFYRPYMLGFENLENEWRKELVLESENLPKELIESEEYLQRSLDQPTEVYVFESDISQKFYIHLTELFRNGESFFSILITSYIDEAPSFVFYRTLTQSQSLLNKYRVGDLVKDRVSDAQIEVTKEREISPEEFEISDEVLEEVEVKKSMILADMLAKRSDSDISFERFIEFDLYLEKTLQSPDEIYEFHDDHGDTLYTNIKSFVKGDESFFYVVLTMPYKFKAGDQGQVQIPIIGFPSNDGQLYPQYAQGKLMNEKLKS